MPVASVVCDEVNNADAWQLKERMMQQQEQQMTMRNYDPMMEYGRRNPLHSVINGGRNRVHSPIALIQF